MPVRQRLIGWLLGAAVVAPLIALPAVFPRLGWVRRLSWRGRLRLALVQTAWGTIARHWVVPPLRRLRARAVARREQIRADLAAELGREPTDGEMDAGWRAWMATRAAEAA